LKSRHDPHPELKAHVRKPAPLAAGEGLFAVEEEVPPDESTFFRGRTQGFLPTGKVFLRRKRPSLAWGKIFSRPERTFPVVRERSFSTWKTSESTRDIYFRQEKRFPGSSSHDLGA